MRFYSNPLLVEGWKLYFSDQRILRVYRVYLALLGLSLLLCWPKQGMGNFLLAQTPPYTYQLMIVSTFVVCTFLSGRFGLQHYGRYQMHSLSSWLKFTPLHPVRIIGGKVTLALMHSIFLTMLALPFLIVAASPSGVPIEGALTSTLILLICATSYRIIGLFFLAAMEDRPLAAGIVLWAIILTLNLLSLYLFPRANAVLAMIRIATQDMRSLPSMKRAVPDAVGSLTAHVILSLAALVASTLWLIIAKRKDRPTGGKPPEEERSL
jgi:hypothetical protein